MRQIGRQYPAQPLRRALAVGLATGLATVLATTPARAQVRTTTVMSHEGPTLHVNKRWTECSFQLDPSLTQAAWRQFTGEAAVVTYFRPLVDARPMGRGAVELSLLQWQSGINDNDAAWNDTMVHPDSTHWLYEGPGLKVPGITARVGVTDRTDVGVYFTRNSHANYGVYGVQVQHALVDDATSGWSAAARVSFVSMFGPDDLDFSVSGVDLLASRSFAFFSNRAHLSPYVTASGTMARSHAKSALVSVHDETVLGAQASVGAVLEAWGARVAFEVVAARVPNVSMKVGFGLPRLGRGADARAAAP
ncbi:MAG: hypothetical protein HY275_15735 [Gemmatimonadetes bacterium]|nr:hypothetical protein [Gemmatimonadota bacterium]